MSISLDIRKKLGDFSLDISFETDAKRIGILGPSGCGKSMTLKSIAGIERPDGGRIQIDDRVLFDQKEKVNLKPQKRRVGYMFQNYALFPTMNVVQNIGAGLGLTEEDRAARVSEMIERFHLHGLEKHLPGQLSGGQQQRVALARIMAYKPDIILLDEPFSALDEHLKERLQHELMTMLEDYEGQVILVSHSRDEIYRFSEELLIMDSGHVMARGKTAQLFDDPGTVAVARMTGCKNFSAAERLDDHRIRLTDWGIALELEREIPEGINAVGYRAHAFEPVWGERQKNCLAFHLSGVDELPFERRYYLLPEDSDSRTEDSGAGGPLRKDPSELICWFIQDSERAQMDGKPTPDYLRLREESIMLLRK